MRFVRHRKLHSEHKSSFKFVIALMNKPQIITQSFANLPCFAIFVMNKLISVSIQHDASVCFLSPGCFLALFPLIKHNKFFVPVSINL